MDLVSVRAGTHDPAKACAFYDATSEPDAGYVFHLIGRPACVSRVDAAPRHEAWDWRCGNYINFRFARSAASCAC